MTDDIARRYRLPAGTSIRPFDSSSVARVFLVEGHGGARWEVSAATAALLENLGEGAMLAEVIGPLSHALGVAPDLEQLERYVDERLVAQGLVVPVNDVSGDDADLAPPRPRLESLTIRGTLLSPSMAARVAAPFTALMTPWAFAVGGTLTLALATFASWRAGRAQAVEPADLMAARTILLFVLGAVMHEIGHVAAARRFGSAHGRIGFGLYLVFPTFFVELDDVWRLTRGQRVIVDLAGIYLQLLFGLTTLVVGAAVADHFPAFHAAAETALGASVATVMVNLNPAFRFDGYWLLSDALGVANLRLRGLATLRSLVSRNNSTAGASPLRPLPAAAAFLIAVASSLFAVWWLGRLVFKLPSFVRVEYIPHVRAFFHGVAAGEWPSVGLLGSLMVQTALLIGAVLMLGILASTASRRRA